MVLMKRSERADTILAPVPPREGRERPAFSGITKSGARCQRFFVCTERVAAASAASEANNVIAVRAT
jgi:hypothetical protein